ncbi:MAG: hypothetical protein R3F31_23365 [Verrucomicrobiales bacterium]
MTHHLLRVYYHERKGDSATAALLRKLGTKADVARDLAYKLFTVCENRKWSREAQAYNALVMGWPDLVRLAREVHIEPRRPFQRRVSFLNHPSFLPSWHSPITNASAKHWNSHGWSASLCGERELKTCWGEKGRGSEKRAE